MHEAFFVGLLVQYAYLDWMEIIKRSHINISLICTFVTFCHNLHLFTLGGYVGLIRVANITRNESILK